MENESLTLLTPPPEEKLAGWLAELYGKDVRIEGRDLLRHRDLSFVERLFVRDALPESLIYKVVLPPWDVEQDLHERVLIPSISNSARLFLSGQSGQLLAMFMEDLGATSLLGGTDDETAQVIGTELAKMHRAYSYRIDELEPLGILRAMRPADYIRFALGLAEQLAAWNLLCDDGADNMLSLARLLAEKLDNEPVSLVHGDLYAENILLRAGKFYMIDWSWFTVIGVPTLDLATLLSDHFKNGNVRHWQKAVLESYCDEAGRDRAQVESVLPVAYTLSRLQFLQWLVERRRRGIMGTTVGPVDGVISDVVCELEQRRQALLSA